MKEINLSRIIRYGIVGFFLLPFLFFAWKFKFQVDLNVSELWWALKNSIYQSTLAAFFVMALAVPMSFGLAQLPVRQREVAYYLLLLPQILPVFFTALICFSVVKPFPMGSAGIIILFSVVNVGLATVLVYQTALTKLNSLAVTAEVFSLSRFKFLTRIYFPALYADLLPIFFLIFVFCMSSFSIPLLAGDGRAVNLEILVYEKVFIETNWAAGFGVSMVQSFLVVAMSLLMLESATANNSGRFATVAPFLKSKWLLFLPALYLLLYAGGYLTGVFRSVSYFGFLSDYSGDILQAMLFSLQALLIFVLLNCALLYLWLLDYLKSGRFNPVLHFVSLSTVVVGFAVYLFFPTSASYDLLKFLLAAVVLLFVPLFKLFLQGPVESLSRQLQVAKVLGLSSGSIILNVILRQLSGPVSLWLSVLCVWFASDYAISRAVGVQTQTLGLMAQGFLSSYRMPAAFLMSLVIIIFVAVFLLALKFLVKVLYVTYKKFAV